MAKKSDPNWIEDSNMKKGALHRATGTPQGQKIPAKKMAAVAKKSPLEAKRVQMAKNMRGG